MEELPGIDPSNVNPSLKSFLNDQTSGWGTEVEPYDEKFVGIRDRQAREVSKLGKLGKSGGSELEEVKTRTISIKNSNLKDISTQYEVPISTIIKLNPDLLNHRTLNSKRSEESFNEWVEGERYEGILFRARMGEHNFSDRTTLNMPA